MICISFVFVLEEETVSKRILWSERKFTWSLLKFEPAAPFPFDFRSSTAERQNETWEKTRFLAFRRSNLTLSHCCRRSLTMQSRCQTLNFRSNVSKLLGQPLKTKVDSCPSYSGSSLENRVKMKSSNLKGESKIIFCSRFHSTIDKPRFVKEFVECVFGLVPSWFWTFSKRFWISSLRCAVWVFDDARFSVVAEIRKTLFYQIRRKETNSERKVESELPNRMENTSLSWILFEFRISTNEIFKSS